MALEIGPVREVSINDAVVRRRGILLVATGSLLLSPDSLLLRLMTIDVWTVVMFRGLFGFLAYVVILRIEGTLPGLGRSWPAPRTVLICWLSAAANVCFVYSVRHTAVALALVIIATAPVFTAIIGAAFTGDRVEPRTWIAVSLVLAGVASIFALRPQGGPLLPDITALCGALSLAVMIVVVRRGGQRSVVPAQAGGSLLTALVVLPFAHPWGVSARNLGIAAGSGLLLLPVALVMVMRGPRYLAAPEVSLLLLLETVLGPVWVWLALGEAPSLQTALTAAVIIVALAVNALLTQSPAGSVRAGPEAAG
jgi:drug/metabolite transporter (DMT)-like permease